MSTVKYPNQSPELTLFYTAIQTWIDFGCSEDTSCNFRRHVGLCSNLNIFAYSMGYSISSVKNFNDELREQFKHSNIKDRSPIYPFNVDLGDYQNESNCYTNPERLAWIKDHI